MRVSAFSFGLSVGYHSLLLMGRCLPQFFYRCFLVMAFTLVGTPLFGVMARNGLGGSAVSDVTWKVAVGDRALQGGVPGLAEQFYTEALALGQSRPSEREEIMLKRASAYIAMGHFREASNELFALHGLERSDYFLRVAMVAFAQGQALRMQEFLDKCTVEDLTRSDAFWYYLIKGASSAQRGYSVEAKEFWAQAKERAQGPTEEAQLEAVEFRVALTPETLVAPETLDILREKVLLYQGYPAGIEFVKDYAIALDQQGKTQEALELIQKQLEVLPASQKRKRAYLYLLEGLLAGVSTEQGQAAFQQLLSMRGQLKLKRIALYALAGDQVSVQDSAGFQAFLDDLIASGKKQAFTGELVLLRAYFALAQGDWEGVSLNAKRFVDDYSQSPLCSEAYLLLAYASWKKTPPQYRLTAEYLSRAQALMPKGEEHDVLGVLVADSYFLNENYRESANVYQNLLKQEKLLVSRGAVLYQWTLSVLRLGKVKEVVEYLDNPAHLKGVERYYRWRIEWNVVQALRSDKRVQDAFSRIESLLGRTQEQDMDPEFRFELLLLEAQLSLDVGQVDKTPFLVDHILTAIDVLPQSLLSVPVRGTIVSQALLLKGEALIRERSIDRGFLVLEELQNRYPESRAAELSYLVEARYYASVDRRVDAQQRLIALADKYPKSDNAPIALYEAALNAESRGLKATRDEALSILERLIKSYPDSGLVFSARMLQADILRKMNEFGVAQLIYENLIYQYPKNEGRYRAMLARADCLFAGARSAGDWEGAISAYERMYDLSAAPLDLRLESGYKWALTLLKSGKERAAQKVYWELLVKYLIENTSELSGDGKSRYWMARSLFELAALLEKEDKPGEAANVYAMVLSYDLPGRRLAQAKLDKIKVLTD